MSTESIPNQTYQSVSATDDAVIVEDKHEVTDPSSPAKAPELAWKNLNFLLGEKKILSDNWGKVVAINPFLVYHYLYCQRPVSLPCFHYH